MPIPNNPITTHHYGVNFTAQAIAGVKHSDINDRRIVTLVIHSGIDFDSLIEMFNTGEKRKEILSDLGEVIVANIFRNVEAVDPVELCDVSFPNVEHDQPACEVEFPRMLSENRAANMG